MEKNGPEPLFIFRSDNTEPHCSLIHSFNSDKEILLVGTRNGKLHVWDLKSSKRIRIVEISATTCISLHVIKEYLITQDKLCELKVWLPNNDFQLIHSKTFMNIGFCKIDVLENYDENTIAIPQPKSVVDLYSFKQTSLQKLCSLKFCDEIENVGEVLHLKLFDFKSKFTGVAVVYENGVLIIWNTKSEIIVKEKLIDDCPMAFDFDINCKQGVVSRPRNGILFFKLDDDFKIMKRKSLSNFSTSSLCVRNDSKIVAVGCENGVIRIYSWKTCKLLAVLNNHSDMILSLMFNKFYVDSFGCNNLLLATSNDRHISLWCIYEQT